MQVLTKLQLAFQCYYKFTPSVWFRPNIHFGCVCVQ